MSDNEQIYIRFRGRIMGPLTIQRARELVARGQLTRVHEVSTDKKVWCNAEKFEQLFRREETSTSLEKFDDIEVEEPYGLRDIPPASTPEIGKKYWYVLIDGQNCGPVELEQLESWIKMGKVGRETLVWKQGMENWLAAELVDGNWFHSPSHNFRAGNSSGYSGPLDGSGSEDLSLLPRELTKLCLQASHWRMFVGIVIFVLASLFSTMGLVWLVIAMSHRSGVAPGLFALFIVVTGIAWLVVAILLLRFNSARSVLQYDGTTLRLKESLRRETLFWTVLGIFTLAWLSIVGFGLIVIFLAGVQMSSLFSQ